MKKVHKVSLEFLRHGPAHNQLLSPLTQYLGLCGNFGAGTVHVPYEHQEFLALLKSLRYSMGGVDDAERRKSDVNKTAKDVTNILASIPGLSSSLGTACRAEVTVTHLELVLSAAELAMLPFELAKVPPGCEGGEGNDLLLQPRLPVCLTRRVRSSSSDAVIWPRKPKILLVIAHPSNLSVPAREHSAAMLDAVAPWVPYFDPSKTEERAEKIGDVLTILTEASIDEIQKACARDAYSHVHILAHGMENKHEEGSPYGLALHDPGDKSKIDVVSGVQLASALRPLRPDASTAQNATLPAVVTVAACDSGNVSSVISSNGASLAHELHQAGIPVVVASQFPLSKVASVHVVEVLYQRMLWGEDLRIILHSLRSRLRVQCPDTHDWASLVIYAALPSDIDDQLLNVRYAQARRAIECALGRIDNRIKKIDEATKAGAKRAEELTDRVGEAAGHAPTTKEGCEDEGRVMLASTEMSKGVEELLDRVDEAARHMPTTEGYETEGRGMLASTEKRKSEMLFRLFRTALKQSKADDKQNGLKRSLDLLWKSLHLYEQAYRENMREADGITRKRQSVHWVMTQYLSLRAVLGESFQPDHWGAATVSTDVDFCAWEGHAQASAWAHGSMAELYLMLLAYDPADMENKVELSQEDVREKARWHTGQLRSIAGHNSFPVYSTIRQFERYTDWWGDKVFVDLLEGQNITRQRPWDEPGGLNKLADELKRLLGKK